MLSRKIGAVLRGWLPLAVAMTLLAGIIYGWLQSFATGQKAEWVDDKPLDGQPARHLRLQMAPGKFDMTQLAQEEGDKLPLSGLGDIMSRMAVDVQGTTDVWLSAADLMPLQQRITLGWDMSIPAGKAATPATLRTTISLDMRPDKINQPVQIRPPI